MRKPTRSQKNYITGLRLRVPGNHSDHGNVDSMTFIEAIAEIERLRQIEKKSALVTCDWCGDECEPDLHPIEDNEGNAIACLPFAHQGTHFCNDHHRNSYQIMNDYPPQETTPEKQAIEKTLDDFAAKGKEAWKDVPDASKFVEDLRKGDLQDYEK